MSLEQDEIWEHLDQLTKPPRSLGQLEELAARLSLIQQTLAPVTSPRRLVLFAADHGVVEAGVTAWPPAVTRLMIQNIRAGRAASSVLARQTRTELVLVDVGTLDAEQDGTGGQLPPADSEALYYDRRVRSGSANLAVEPAMTVEQFQQALSVGQQMAQQAIREGVRILAAGEMGIGNTAAASCLTMLLADVPLEQAVGRGAGADDAILERKRSVVESAADRARQNGNKGDSVSAIASVAGLEIAAIAGLFLEAAEQRQCVVLDGYVATAGALIAECLQPGTARWLIAAHRSAEPGHRAALEHLGLTPMLEWNMRLGEGTAALLLMPLLDAAAAVTGGMATLSELGLGVKATL